ncbi:MAG: amidohydrolase [Clostridiaceae bacterium]|nr:amidohydrolase [Clostridiaceae bacterium]
MLLIRNAHLKTMAGPDIENGCLLLRDGKIADIGEHISAPAEAEIIDAGGRLVTPGCMDGHCHIGLWNSGVGVEGHDFNEVVDPISPQMRAIDSINPQDECFSEALRGGVTCAATGVGGVNALGGTFVALKLYGRRIDDMILKYPIAVKAALGENPKSFYTAIEKSPQTRMMAAALMREGLFRARRYMEDKEKGKQPAFDLRWEALIPVLKREIPIKAHAHRADDICTALRIAREFNIRVTIEHCTDGPLIADVLAKEGVAAFVGPSLHGKSKIEIRSLSFKTPGILDRAGVPVSIVTDAPEIPLQHLPLCAGLAVCAGMDRDAAWRAITITPAIHCEVGDRIGSLEKGKDADVVIWEDDPLTRIGAEALITIVDGTVVYRK